MKYRQLLATLPLLSIGLLACKLDRHPASSLPVVVTHKEIRGAVVVRSTPGGINIWNFAGEPVRIKEIISASASDPAHGVQIQLLNRHAQPVTRACVFLVPPPEFQYDPIGALIEFGATTSQPSSGAPAVLASGQTADLPIPDSAIRRIRQRAGRLFGSSEYYTPVVWMEWAIFADGTTWERKKPTGEGGYGRAEPASLVCYDPVPPP